MTGRKIWQSYAQDMDCLWLLCRTGSQESRGKGLSLLIVDIDAPGVRVTAHPTLDGDQLNEVHLESVEVPISYSMWQNSEKWRIYDVKIEGVSLVKNYRNQFSKILFKDTPDHLIERIKKKNQNQEGGIED